MPSTMASDPTFCLPEPESAEPVQIIRTKQEPQNFLNGSEVSQLSQKVVPQYRWKIVWKNVIAFVYLHCAGLFGLYLIISGQAQWRTFVFTIFMGLLVSQGVTTGAHRLWAHRTYKAKLGLRVFLAICQTIAMQNCIYEWVRDHRVHHKFTDTDADPHNASRGFFFSHMGWLCVTKHNDVKEKGKTVDMSDMLADPVVKFQKDYYMPFAILFGFVIPTIIPWYFWGENIIVAYHTATIFRYALTLNVTWSVNSAAHIWGMKPYDKSIKPVENLTVSILSMGEGFHNFHHIFPWDYKAAELGDYKHNFSTAFIDLMAKWGYAYDLKTTSEDLIRKRILRTGDGSWKSAPAHDVQQNGTGHHNGHHHGHDDQDRLWGWGDKDMEESSKGFVEIHHKAKSS